MKKAKRTKKKTPSFAGERILSDEEVLAAAESDPDARPATSAQLRTGRRLPEIKRLRWALGLTQEVFAKRYGIQVATLRDWEQGRSKPDATAQSYIKVIRGDPKKIARLLEAA